MNLYIIIVLDPDGPYVWADGDCGAEAECTASRVRHETGYDAVVKCVEVPV